MSAFDDDDAAGAAEAQVLYDAIRPVLAGRSPQVVGALLMELTAMWLVGFQPSPDGADVNRVRAEMLHLFTVTALEMTPVLEQASNVK